MSRIRSPHGTPLLRLIAGALGLLLALPAGAYDFPLSSNAIRDAYFLGIRQGSLDAQFRAKYEPCQSSNKVTARRKSGLRRHFCRSQSP
jgi:hypothetical protein